MAMTVAWRAGDAGGRLDGGIRAILEAAFDTDLSGVRVHCGPRTDAFLRHRRLTAAAAGHRVYLPTPGQLRGREGDGREGDGGVPAAERGWLRILAHEVAHTIQQAAGLGRAAAGCEAGAELAAAAVVAGRPVPAGWLRLGAPRVPGSPAGASSAGPDRRAPRAGHGTVVLAGFNSWEHQLLGDLTGAQLTAIASKTGTWADVIAGMLAMLQLWVPGNATVTPDQLRAAMPGITAVTLPNNCVATYGEICALADFIADADALGLSAQYVFPFLQQIRQETYNRLLALRDGEAPVTQFGKAITPYAPTGRVWSPAAKAAEMLAIDKFSAPLGEDHYAGLLARNACHFAPFAWYRWKEAGAAAATTAQEARRATSGPEAGQLTDLAWAQLAYAEHFVQDCFAPGHLTNKTLVMQYFLDWVGQSYLIPVQEWESVREVSLAHQPDLWGGRLYNDRYLMLWSNDPQTAEEQSTFAARMSRTGVTAFGRATTEQAYHQYLAFLRSSVVQLSSNQVHDYFNANGLYVSMPAGQPYRIYGDENLFATTAQVGVMAPVLDDFRETVRQVFRGYHPPGPERTLAQLPQYAGSDASALSPLDSWNTGELKQQVAGIFGSGWSYVKDVVTALGGPSMGIVSVDQLVGGMEQSWRTPLGGTGTVTVHWDGQRLFAGAAGVVYELSPADGSIIARNPLSDVSAYDIVSFASDGDTLYAGKNGYVFALAAADITQRKATSGKLDLTWSTVEQLLTDDGHLYVSAAGYLYELDRGTLAQVHYNELSGLGTFAARFAASGDVLVVGINGQVLCLRRDDLTTQIGSTASMMTPEPNVAVLGVGGQVWAACAQSLGQVSLASGGFALLSSYQNVSGEARLGVCGDHLLQVVNGMLYAVDLRDGHLAGDVALSPTGVPAPDSSAGNVLVTGGNAFASANGYVYRIDAAQATILNPGQAPVGDKAEVRMACDGVRLFCGVTSNGNCQVVSFLLDPPAA